MSRYCTIAKYKTYFNSSKHVKNSSIDSLFKTHLQELWTQAKTTDSAGLVNKIKDKLSQFKNEFQKDPKVLCSIQNILEERKYKTKNVKKYIRKEAEKLCQNLSKPFSRDKTFAWAAAATIGVETVDKTPASPLVFDIPEPPTIPSIPEGTEEVINQLNALGEPTFASLGLGGYTPVGLIQYCMEYLHVTLGVDWWLAIMLGTLVIRCLLFPLVVIAQRNAAKMNNYLPQMQAIQMKMTEARQTGNQFDAARYSQELMLFMREKQLNPLKNMIVPLAQMPIFVSFFMGLRQMTNVPVESLTTGGLWWFQDLTMPDQYFLLPIITSATLYATIELGTDSAKLSAQNMQLMKYVLRGLPLVVLPFTVNFPGAILCYWVSSNFISLAQVAILRIPRVRDYFKIEPLQTHKPENLPMKPKGFKDGIKDTWTNLKITRELEERRRIDELKFQRAGKGPIVKTYKYDPTKQVEPSKSAPISAKKR